MKDGLKAVLGILAIWIIFFGVWHASDWATANLITDDFARRVFGIFWGFTAVFIFFNKEIFNIK